MARVLVTGGRTGIGQAVLAQLIDDGHEVISTSRHPQPDQASVEWFTLDLSKPDSVQAFCNRSFGTNQSMQFLIMQDTDSLHRLNRHR